MQGPIRSQSKFPSCAPGEEANTDFASRTSLVVKRKYARITEPSKRAALSILVLMSSYLLFSIWQMMQSTTTTTTDPTLNLKHPTSMSTRNLVVGGMARNVEGNLSLLLKTIQRVIQEGNFTLVRAVFFENDSTDATNSVIKGWNFQPGNVLFQKVDVITEVNVRGRRTTRLAHGRNIVWKHITQLSKRQQVVDYVLLLDMDNVNMQLKGVDECFQLPQGWGGCCANQYREYYDLWALRTLDDWVPCDVWIKKCMTWYRFRASIRHIPASTQPIEVKSCFGGATLYNFHKIVAPETIRYDGVYRRGPNAGKDICEHVPFHQAIQLANPDFKLYIQPKMLNENLEMHEERVSDAIQKSHNDSNIGHYYVRPN